MLCASVSMGVQTIWCRILVFKAGLNKVIYGKSFYSFNCSSQEGTLVYTKALSRKEP